MSMLFHEVVQQSRAVSVHVSFEQDAPPRLTEEYRLNGDGGTEGKVQYRTIATGSNHIVRDWCAPFGALGKNKYDSVAQLAVDVQRYAVDKIEAVEARKEREAEEAAEEAKREAAREEVKERAKNRATA